VGSQTYNSGLELSKEETSSQIYTLPYEYIDSIFEECDIQISVVSDLLKELLDKEAVLHNKETIIPVISELMWVNHSILRKLNIEIDSPVFHHNEETQEDEYVFTERTILDLQNLLVTRFMAVVELNRFSCSIGLH